MTSTSCSMNKILNNSFKVKLSRQIYSLVFILYSIKQIIFNQNACTVLCFNIMYTHLSSISVYRENIIFKFIQYVLHIKKKSNSVEMLVLLMCIYRVLFLVIDYFKFQFSTKVLNF